MNNNQLVEFSDLMDSVMPVYRMEVSAATKKIWWALLVKFELQDVAQAFAEHLRVNSNTITPADIIKQLDRIRPDGRLGVEEAWAMMARDESETVVVTEEMMEAMRFAQPLLNEGDQIGARMAFKEAYLYIVDTNRRTGVVPRWFPSIGTDKESRDKAVSEAVRLGRLPASHAIGLMAPDKVPTMLEMAGEKALALEYKPSSNSDIADRIAALYGALSRKSVQT